MSRLALSRWPAVVACLAALLLGGCKPIDWISPTSDPRGGVTDPPPVVDPPAPDPEPVPEPDPVPDPTPTPGELGVVVSSTNLIVPEGGEASLSVKLSADPAADRTVVVHLTVVNGTMTYAGAASLSFNSANWDVGQMVAVSSPEDPDQTDGVGMLDLTLDGAAPVVVNVVAADNDVPEGDGVRLTVKDGSLEGATDYPVTAVIPLEYGRYQTIDKFRLTDAAGTPVAAQFEVVNRWWARDNSIRHVAAHFLATVAPASQSYYFFKTDNGTKGTPAKSVSVTNATGSITVDTGTVRFRISKTAFNLFDEVFMDQNGDGTYASTERIVAPGASDGEVFTGRLAGDIQRARDRSDLKFLVEEAGPMRAVIRVSGLTTATNQDDIKHGFAVRFYAYAGKPYVKVDYQLQNSAKNIRFAGPMYFEDVTLSLKTDFTGTSARLSAKPGQAWSGAPGAYLFQNLQSEASVRRLSDDGVLKSATFTIPESAFAWTDLNDGNHGVAVIVRHMAEMWPNVVEVATGGNINVRLWPKQSCEWMNGSFTSSGLYWLDDMQHVVKEVLFWFHGAAPTDGDLDKMAANFTYNPVPFVPVSEYRRTRVTTDLLGLFPKDAGLDASNDTRRAPAQYPWETDPSNGFYEYGWRDFGGDGGRRSSANAGGWPNGVTEIFASGRYDRYVKGERDMWGDLNCRPMWLADYDHDTDFDLVRPSINPYASDSWRCFDGVTWPKRAWGYLPNTAWSGWTPRDQEHFWTYHIEDFYYASYNLWIKDWYKFIAEFRKRTLFMTKIHDPTDPYMEWVWETRGEGHLMASATQAYRVTGDAQLLDGIRCRLNWFHNLRIDPQYGVINPPGESAFQNGFFARSLLGIYSELRGGDPEYAAKAFNLYWGLMDWHYNTGRWAYYVNSADNNSGVASSGTALTMVDPVACFYLLTGRKAVRDDMIRFVDSGLNGGERPYGAFPTWTLSGPWTSGWEGRAQEYVRLYPKADETAPSAISDLSARLASGKAHIEWTAPADAARYFAVWSTLPISRTYTKAADQRNFWACQVIPNNLVGTPGSKQSLDVGGLPAGQKVYFAVVSFDANDNLSDVSNVTSLDMP